MNVGEIGNLDEDDEDEETLQLQLQEIQARLKLKKLQKAKLKDKGSSDAENDASREEARPLSRAVSSAAGRIRQDIAELKEHRLEKSKSQANVLVPGSPTRRAQKQEIQRSPSRILLGIDKGIKASDVSLRRVPSTRKLSEDTMVNAQRAAGYLQRASSQIGIYDGNRAVSALGVERAPTSFSERMASVRNQDAERRERDARIKQSRNKAFDIDEMEMEKFKSEAALVPEIQAPPPEFSRDQILDGYNKPTSGLLQRSKSTSQITSTSTANAQSRSISTNSAVSTASRPSSRATTSRMPANESRDPSVFESFSSLHLSKRIIPHTVLTRTLSGKKTFTIPDLLKEVIAPAFQLPDIEEDVVLLAVIASKSDPKTHKAKAGKEESKKFMAMTLTDLKWELDLYLFDTAFEKFWKLMPGTVIAILNPGIMPPMKADTGRFSMTLNSSDDTILEIGNSRDLGFCKSVKKDGNTCDSWIDKRHTEHCEFHINETLRKTKAGRMEVNTMDFGGRKKWGSGAGERKYNSKHVSNFDKPAEKKDGSRYDRESHSKVFMTKGGRTTADLFDDVDVDPDAFHRGSNKEERMRRQLATVEKERELARKLAEVGGGLGADYLRKRDQPAPSIGGTLDGPPEPPDAAALGLLGGKAQNISLSPMKRKRTGTNPLNSNSAVGWGGNLSKELGRMKDGERLQPIKKKTRFVTAKGIREAGRESFGPDVNTPTVDDDDDDDLDIIK